LTAVISTFTSRAVWPDGFAMTAKARKPLADAEAPTFCTDSDGAGVGVGAGVAVLLGAVITAAWVD
jgi:hypothetical protein